MQRAHLGHDERAGMSLPAAKFADPLLPGLALALDPVALVDLLSQRLPECARGAEVLDVRPHDVQYTPGEGASILLKLKMRDGQTGRTGRQLLFARALPPGAPAPRVAAAVLERYERRCSSGGRRHVGPLRTPVLGVPEVGLVIHAYPVDPSLTSLVDATDPEAMKEAFHQAWQPRRVRVRRVKVETLSYTPGARAALRYEVLAENKDTGLPELRRLVGKVQMRKAPSRLFSGHWALWQRTFGRVAIVPPVGYVATAQLSLQEFVSGTRLSDLAGTGAFVGFVRKAGRSLAVVHSTVLPLLAQRSVEKEARVVRRWTEVLVRLRPLLARRLEKLQERLLSELSARMRFTGTVHADFHLANLLADSDGVTLIDCDQVAHGDAMVDVGRFLGSLRVCALRLGERDPNALADAGEFFLQAYLRQRRDDERRARLFESIALLIAAASPFRLQRDGWDEGAESMVAEAERVLEASTRGPAVATAAADTEVPRISAEERVQWALDPVYSQALLVPLFREAHGSDIELTECCPSLVLRTDDLLHVRWTIKGYRGRERWRGSAEGFGFAGRRGGGLLRRLTALHGAVSELPESLGLPRPLGALSPLGLIAVEPRRGRRLTDLLDGEAAGATLDRLGRALAQLASTPATIRKLRPVDRELRGAHSRCEKLAAERRPEAARIDLLLGEVGLRVQSASVPLAVTLHGLELNDLVVDELGVAARRVRDIVLAPAHAGIGSLLAELTHASVRRDETLPGGARRLRAAYCEASGAPPTEVAAFEALAILRRCCHLSLRRPGHDRTVRLLDLAERALID